MPRWKWPTIAPGGRASLLSTISSNAALRLWSIVLQIFLTPIIIALLGPPSYGLVGFSATLMAFLAFLDQCVSPALSRELARYGAAAEKSAGLRNLLRSLECVSVATALVLGGAIVFGARWIADFGIAGGGLSQDEIVRAIRWIGVCLMCQWPATLYGGGVIGLERQDLLVGLRLVLGTLAPVGAVLLLWLVRPSVELYLAWTAAIALTSTVIVGRVLWRIMPPGPRPRFEYAQLVSVWRFAVGSLLVGLTTALIAQAPGLIVAKYCSLSDVAAYTMAVSLALQITTILTQPVTGSLVPHLTRMIERGNEAELAREYHRWTQILIALLLPVSATLAWFAKPLIQLWLGAASPLVEPVAALLPWIAAGTVVNTMVTPPYLLQIAHGWTRLSIVKNILAAAFNIPALLMLVPRYGPFGAALCWLVVNLSYYVVEVPIMHRFVLRGEGRNWLWFDTLVPTLAVALLYFLAVESVSFPRSAWGQLAIAGGTACVAWAFLAMCLPFFRASAKDVVLRARQAILKMLSIQRQ